LRFDKAFHVMLGIERFPGTDTVRNFFARFTQGTIDTIYTTQRVIRSER
jgi:hypothetical protein